MPATVDVVAGVLPQPQEYLSLLTLDSLVYPVTCSLLLVAERPLAIKLSVYSRTLSSDHTHLVSLLHSPFSTHYDTFVSFFHQVLLNLDLQWLVTLPGHTIHHWTFLLPLLRY